MAILDENEFTEVEGRSYLNPQIALDEANTFIDNLRSTQQANNQQIKTDTYNLGTSVPSNLGGLTGGESYFTSRYQVPQTASVVNELRSAAQSAALNQVLQNEQDMWKKRYNDAYRAYQKSAYDKSNTSGGGSGGGEGDIDTNDTTININSVSTEGLIKSMYLRKFQEYINQGFNAAEAEARAKADLGVATKVDTSENSNSGVTKKKSAIGGDNSFIYTLPSGRTVLVDESKYELIPTSNGYVLRNLETGEAKEVGR